MHRYTDGRRHLDCIAGGAVAVTRRRTPRERTQTQRKRGNDEKKKKTHNCMLFCEGAKTIVAIVTISSNMSSHVAINDQFH